MYGRCSLNAMPATAWPDLMPPVRPHSGTSRMASPAEYAQSSDWVSSSQRSMRDPSDPRRRAASTTMRSSTSVGSRIDETRTAISRSVRSDSAVRSRAARDSASSVIRLALVIAMAAWLVRARISAASSSWKASDRTE